MGAPFQQGDRVRVINSYDGRMKIQGWIGEVQQQTALATGWKIRLKWEPTDALAQSGYAWYWDIHAKYLVKVALPKPPKFSSVEEADAWMAQHAEQTPCQNSNHAYEMGSALCIMCGEPQTWLDSLSGVHPANLVDGVRLAR